MSTDEYVPSDNQVRGRYSDGAIRQGGLDTDDHLAAFDAWLARVKRDAAREALDGLADQFNNWAEVAAEESARIYRDTHYPEETP